jgi:hypothetical protein
MLSGLSWSGWQFNEVSLCTCFQGIMYGYLVYLYEPIGGMNTRFYAVHQEEIRGKLRTVDVSSGVLKFD